MHRIVILLLLSGSTALVAEAGESLHVTPDDDMRRISARLAADRSITELVLADGVYRNGLRIAPLEHAGPEPEPLLIRPAEGARVIFDGARTITGSRRVKNLPGVYSIQYDEADREAPAVWEPDARVRYTLVADSDAVRRFPASYSIVGRRLYFHTPDGMPPDDRTIRVGHEDFGLLILRSHVTVQELQFRNFVARGKGSAGIRIEADHVTVASCSVSNASFGFRLSGNHGAILGCTARDVGGGVYLDGTAGRVEDCRFFKKRDRFAIPTYAQDDTGIQFYFPARGGVVRRNLIVGFSMGVLIKADRLPYLVEHNTLVGQEGRLGFVATEWHPEAVFRRNVVSGYEEPLRLPAAVDRRGVGENCYAFADRLEPDSIAPDSTIGAPGFLRPAAEDYRLARDSECLAQLPPGEPIGFASPSGADAASLAPSREWHVSPTGRDGGAGTPEYPVRTAQFALDRAAPGDTILLHPGIYPDPITIRSGGEPGRPLTLRAVKKWEAVLDSGRRAEIMIDVDGATFVEIRDLEIRWYREIGVRINESPDVTVSGCRIWNAHWKGIWPTGVAVQVDRSPRFTGDHNVLFRQEHGFILDTSPASRLSFNTCAGNLYSAATFIRSIEGSVCRNNSFAFQGNDVLQIDVPPGETKALSSFDCDYNNYGTYVREQPNGNDTDQVIPRQDDRGILYESKAIVRYREGPGRYRRFRTMRAWRDFSSLDAHSIFADPLYRSMEGRDFRLLPESPNIGAGEGGATIGAHD